MCGPLLVRSAFLGIESKEHLCQQEMLVRCSSRQGGRYVQVEGWGQGVGRVLSVHRVRGQYADDGDGVVVRR